MADVRRATLGAPLEGHWIDVDVDALTLGALEDIEATPKVGAALDILETIITDTSLVTEKLTVPAGMKPVRAALRALKTSEFRVIIPALGSLGTVPNGS